MRTRIDVAGNCSYLLGLLAAVLILPATAGRAAPMDFNRDVRPILSDHCFACHGPDKATVEADLRLDDEASVKRDRDGYVVIEPGEPDESEMIRRITSNEEYEVMPPPHLDKPLTAAEIATLRQWIAEGAEWAPHWAYVPPVRHGAPQVSGDPPPANWIDNFVLARLESENIAPSPLADRITLLRRVCFDLTGLPPTREQAEAFLADETDDAYLRLVDQLLGSPHYGERMAIYWLDLVRYADTVGYHGDQEQNIAPYREWVINAFNRNLPFDQFTREQLAGDLLPEPTQEQIIATGYNRLLQTTHEGGLQPKEYRAIYAADRVRNVSAVWMGATVGCAQCHDHKFDPYTAKDFYALAAFFADVDDERHFRDGTNDNPTRRHPELELPTPKQTEQIAALQSQFEQLRRDAEIDSLSEEQRKELQTQIKQVDAALKRARAPLTRTMITVALETPREVRVLPRGNWLDETGPLVQPAVPEFLGPLPSDGRATRLDLANWFVDPEHGLGLLTARVLVNRLWYLCFGSGLAGNLDDFGGQGQPPMHPELLDRLAHAFVESGWDIRAIMKLMVTSRSYQQASVGRSDLLAADPKNRFYARQSAFRLPAEMIRDNALSIGGLLVDEVGGPSARPYQPEGYYRHLNFPTRTYQQDNDPRQWRRGVYVHWQRQFLHPMLKAFDAPSREECTAQRPQSNTPLAALTLMNDPTFIEAARGFAERTLGAPAQGDRQRLAWAFAEALARPPADAELAILEDVLTENRADFAQRPQAAADFLAVGLKPPAAETDRVELASWTAVCRTLLNLAETNLRN
jgi:mono/diheme cytochrome c family protein